MLRLLSGPPVKHRPQDSIGSLLPVERNPRRPGYDADRFDKLMAVADRVHMRLGWGEDARWDRSHLRTLLRLAGDTGQR
jgi:hypothetical protein